LVYAARGSDVTTVIINGRVVMEDGRILTFDVQEAMDQVNAIALQMAGRS
jgi:5-methylthioadenosine/S-adenosylhomocysteine deaminase